MIKIKSFILDETNWLEVTWVDEISTQVDVEKEIDNETVIETETKVEDTVVWCGSYSGHPEHLAMLEAKALEFNTPLNDYETKIQKCISAFVAPTEEELAQQELVQKVQEAKGYLISTDYKMTIDCFAQLSKEVQDELIAKRAEAREFIRSQE